jgi:crossover junction endodeoxyribonuclease RuvC
MRVLAIDPGYERCGVAVLEKISGKETILHSDCVRTSATSPFPARLYAVADACRKLLDRYAPEHMALERLYFNSNQKTAMFVAEVRGALIYTAYAHETEIYEYTPAEIKIAVTGVGNATKKQVMLMVPKLITTLNPKALDDEYDAIAIGLTHLAHSR